MTIVSVSRSRERWKISTIIIIIHLKWMMCVAWSKRNGQRTLQEMENSNTEQLRKWLIRFEHRKVQIIQNSMERNWISFWYQLTFRARCSQSRFECIGWLYKNQIGHEIVMTKSWRPNKRDNYLDNSRATKQHLKNWMERKKKKKRGNWYECKEVNERNEMWRNELIVSAVSRNAQYTCVCIINWIRRRKKSIDNLKLISISLSNRGVSKQVKTFFLSFCSHSNQFNSKGHTNSTFNLRKFVL